MCTPTYKEQGIPTCKVITF